jgi:glycosyltransferase involved in cell wall biosynthesis
MAKAEATDIISHLAPSVDRPFLFHIGSNLWYKNRVGVLQLFALIRKAGGIPRHLMVCAGPPLRQAAKDAARDFIEDLVMIPEPSDTLVEALYTCADALLFPSLDEGFGWPIIEAQACGCPVITSDRDPMRDIAGPAALLIDVSRPEVSAERIAARWAWLRGQADAARRHAGRFSQERAGESYADFFAKVLGSRTIGPNDT